MRIVLVHPPSPDPPPNDFGPPWDMAMAAACLREAGVEVSGLDWGRLPDDVFDARLATLLVDPPDVLGLFVRYDQRHHAVAAVAAAHDRGARVVLAGELADAAPDGLQRLTGADAVVLREGEEAWPALARAWSAGGDGAEVPGLVLSGARRTPARPLRHDLDALPDPAYDLIAREIPDADAQAPSTIASDHCSSLRRAFVVHGSRGCHYRCRFCVESKRPSRIRALSPARLAAQMAALYHRDGARDFVIGDSLFTFDRAWALAVCDAIAALRLPLRWSVMTRTDRVDAELLARMAVAGCVEVAYGVESASRDVQRSIDKQLNLDSISPAFAATHAAGLRSVLMLMVGNPGDSVAAVRETLARVGDLAPDRVLVKVTKVELGTRLFDELTARGVTDEDRYLAVESGAHPGSWAELTGAPELAELTRYIRPRTSFVDLSELPDAGDARAAIELASARSARVVLGGAEPLTRADLPALVGHAGAIGAASLVLHTDARALHPARRVDAVRGFGAIDAIWVPLSPLDPDPLSLLGVAEWRKAGGAVVLRVALDRAVVAAAGEVAARLAALRPRGVALYYGRSPEGWLVTPHAALPEAEDAARAVLIIAAALRLRGVAVTASGLPPCLISDDPDLWSAPHAPFDERVGADGPVPLHRLRTDTPADHRGRPTRCPSCGHHAPLCAGVWRTDAEPASLTPTRPARTELSP